MVDNTKWQPIISILYRCHSNLVIFIGIIPNFIYGLLPLDSRSSSNTGFVRRMLTKMADKTTVAYQFALVDTLP